MLKGKVKWYNKHIGFGYIVSDSGEEAFVNKSGLNSSIDSLNPEDIVIFDTENSNRGLMAINVKSAS